MVQVIKATEDGEDVIVEFDDGVWAVFKPYRQCLGYQVEGLRHLYLLSKDNEPLFTLNSRLYRNGPKDDEYKIAFIDKSLAQQDVAKYWNEAKIFVTEKFHPDKNNFSVTDNEYWYRWVIVATEGWFDLARLCKGNMKILSSEVK